MNDLNEWFEWMIWMNDLNEWFEWINERLFDCLIDEVWEMPWWVDELDTWDSKGQTDESVSSIHGTVDIESDKIAYEADHEGSDVTAIDRGIVVASKIIDTHPLSSNEEPNQMPKGKEEHGGIIRQVEEYATFGVPATLEKKEWSDEDQEARNPA